MGRGPVAFALAFVVLPLLGLVGAFLVPSGGATVGLVTASVALLLLGFTLGLVLIEE